MHRDGLTASVTSCRWRSPSVPHTFVSPLRLATSRPELCTCLRRWRRQSISLPSREIIIPQACLPHGAIWNPSPIPAIASLPLAPLQRESCTPIPFPDGSCKYRETLVRNCLQCMSTPSYRYSRKAGLAIREKHTQHVAELFRGLDYDILATRTMLRRGTRINYRGPIAIGRAKDSRV